MYKLKETDCSNLLSQAVFVCAIPFNWSKISRWFDKASVHCRAGHRVMINRLGDLIVRPSPLEQSLRILPMRGSVNQHLLTSYLDSTISVLLYELIRAQKATSSRARVVEIVENNRPLQVRSPVNLTVLSSWRPSVSATVTSAHCTATCVKS